MNTVMIGYGNPLRGDDGLGWHAARQLADDPPPGCFQENEQVEVVACQQLTPDLAARIAAASLVVFLDAASGTGTPPGTISCQTVLPAPLTPGAFSHHLHPSVLLALAQTLYGANPSALLFSVEAASFEYNEMLSEPVQAALPLLLEQVCAMVARRGESL